MKRPEDRAWNIFFTASLFVVFLKYSSGLFVFCFNFKLPGPGQISPPLALIFMM